MVQITAERLRTVVSAVFEGAGARPEDAEAVAVSLVENNLMGHDSHGVGRVGFYVDWVLDGRTNPRGEVTVVRQSATTALLDGGANFGQLAARQAMALAIEKAKEHDLGMVALRNCGHTGRLGEYAVQATEAGLIGLVYSSGCVKGGSVAAYGGTSRLLNTNPIAWAVPAASHPPVFLDFATSIRAQGKFQVAVDKGVRVPEGWLLDAQGNPTTDPAQQMAGGVMLPFGEHKGYCLSFLIDILANILPGESPSPLPSYQPDFPIVMTAMNIAAFVPLDDFRRQVDELIVAAKASRKAPGVAEIMVPGEPEWRTRQERLQSGLDLPDKVWARIVAAGAKCGVQVTL